LKNEKLRFLKHIEKTMTLYLHITSAHLTQHIREVRNNKQ